MSWYTWHFFIQPYLDRHPDLDFAVNILVLVIIIFWIINKFMSRGK
jgi:hypothetical protein